MTLNAVQVITYAGEAVGGLLQRTPGPPDEASPESPWLLQTLTSR